MIWLWIAIIEPTKDREILSISTSKERNMFVVAVAERFLLDIVNKYEHPVSKDDSAPWYPHKGCHLLKIDHHIISLLKKASSKGQCNT